MLDSSYIFNAFVNHVSFAGRSLQCLQCSKTKNEQLKIFEETTVITCSLKVNRKLQFTEKKVSLLIDIMSLCIKSYPKSSHPLEWVILS